MEAQIRKHEEVAMLNDVLTLVSNVRRNSCLKFTEELMQFIYMETECLRFQLVFDYLPFTVPLLHKDTKTVVKLILTLMDCEIVALFLSVKEYIRVRWNLKAYISRLGLLFCGSPYSLLYFFTITSRIASLMLKTCWTISSDFYIETVVEVLCENEKRIKYFGGFNAVNRLVVNIMEDPSLIRDLPRFRSSDLLLHF